MSQTGWAQPRPSPALSVRGLILRSLRVIGAGVREHTRFLFQLGALGYGVVREALGFLWWRRTVRAEFRRVLAQVGYEAEGFGKSTLAIKAVPGGIRHGDPAQLLRALLEEWADDGAPTEEERVERVLAEIACHSVVRAGDRLSPSEAEALLRSMDGADFSTHGPHGRPVLLRLPLAEIARRFGR